MDQHYFIFREPENFDELKALLLLRYKVFRESRLEKFVTENEAGIDLDCYDLYSRHFGLYEHTGHSSRLVGYIRMVTDEPGTFRDELFELAKNIPSIYEKVNRIPNEPFPLMSYFPEADVVRKFHHEIRLRGETLVEASRLSLDPAVRGLKTATFFIAAISAAFIVHGVHEAIMTCVPQQRGFYSQFGFKQFDGTGECYVDFLNYHDVCLNGSAKRLPEPMKEKVYQMSEVYRKMGRICYDPSNPENYYAPLGSYVKSRPVFAPVTEHAA